MENKETTQTLIDACWAALVTIETLKQKTTDKLEIENIAYTIGELEKAIAKASHKL